MHIPTVLYTGELLFVDFKLEFRRNEFFEVIYIFIVAILELMGNICKYYSNHWTGLLCSL